MECDADLADSVAALCELGQQISNWCLPWYALDYMSGWRLLTSQSHLQSCIICDTAKHQVYVLLVWIQT